MEDLRVLFEKLASLLLLACEVPNYLFVVEHACREHVQRRVLHGVEDVRDGAEVAQTALRLVEVDNEEATRLVGLDLLHRSETPLQFFKREERTVLVELVEFDEHVVLKKEFLARFKRSINCQHERAPLQQLERRLRVLFFFFVFDCERSVLRIRFHIESHFRWKTPNKCRSG